MISKPAQSPRSTRTQPTVPGRRAVSGPRRIRGVSLIEILITLLVLSVGLLGVAALQSFSLQAGQVSYLRSQATNFAYELADHARANRSRVIAQSAIPIPASFSTRLNTILPGSSLDTNVVGDQITIEVTWRDDRENGDDASFEFATRI
ncbi:MAG: type IV pilus modification protein PilV [Xanthomonadaceae bacterium]|nr:type IV pilus modification protein PilV [Xanthomonadaceae bacterium]